MFQQTFDLHDIGIIGLLIVLEGVLSIDNALVLGLLAKRLPKHQQSRALTYGLVGAFVFRILAIALAAYLLSWRIVKLVGGAYLVYVAVKHFFFDADDPEQEKIALAPDGTPILTAPTGEPLPPERLEEELEEREPPPVSIIDKALVRKHAGFWSTVAVIELTDIAFAVDSILAAVAMVPSVPQHQTNPKLWVIVTGGMLGVILMRFAAVIFIKLLDRFPRFETSAYLLVVLIGLKLVADWHFNPDPAHPDWRFNFHSPSSPGFWVFWLTMAAFFCIGFIPRREKNPPKNAMPVKNSAARAEVTIEK
jgi:YkoY family integral membrane protein